MSNEDFDTFDSMEEESDGKVTLSEILHNNPSLKLFVIIASVGIIAAGVLLFSGKSSDELPVSRVAQSADVTETPGGQERVPPNYEEALNEKDQQRLEQAARTGRSVMPTPRSGAQDRIEAPALDLTDEDPLELWRRTVENEEVQVDQRRDRELQALAEALDEEKELQAQADATAEEERIKQEEEEERIRKAAEKLAAEMMPPLPPPSQVAQPMPIQPMPTGPTPEQVQARTELVLEQMATILATQVPMPSQVVSLGALSPEQLGLTSTRTEFASSGLNEAIPLDNNDASMTAEEELKPVIMPGDIAYAQMLTEANSDIPGPVLAYVASGPLAGARALGTFSADEDFMTLTFTSAVLDKEQYAIEAYAIDPETTLTGMATSVNKHYFSRVIIPAAASFLEGFADAVTEQGNTTVVVQGETVTTESGDLELEDELLEGASEAISEIASIVDEETNDEPTIIVATGTRFGLLFMQPVFMNEEDSPF